MSFGITLASTFVKAAAFLRLTVHARSPDIHAIFY